MRLIYLDADIDRKIVCVEQDKMEHHREIAIGDERYRVTIDRQIVSQGLAHLVAIVLRVA